MTLQSTRQTVISFARVVQLLETRVRTIKEGLGENTARNYSLNSYPFFHTGRIHKFSAVPNRK